MYPYRKVLPNLQGSL